MILNEKQSSAFNNITNWILRSKESARTLKGYAGTGKTTLISQLTKWLKSYNINYIQCSPTHKAAEVLSNMSGENVITYHSLLNLSPDLSLDNFNIDNPIFSPRSKPFINKNTIIFADECSMINADLTEYLLKLVKNHKSKILFIGDPAQLPPINEEISNTFSFEGDELTEIMRTNVDSILACSTYLRNNLHLNNIDLGKFISDKFIKLSKKELLSYYEELNSDELLNHKYLAYRNNNVNSFNKYVNKLLLGSDSIEEGSLFIPYVSGNSAIELNTKKFELDYHNSSDYKVLKVKETNISVFKNVQVRTETIDFYIKKLLIQDSFGNKSHINLLHDYSYDDYIKWYFDMVKLTKSISMINGDYGRANAWSYLLNVKSSLVVADDLRYDYFNYKATCGFGYGITVHRSQGSTYKNVVVNYDDIMTIKDTYLRNRLLYVAISRASDKVIITT